MPEMTDDEKQFFESGGQVTPGLAEKSDNTGGSDQPEQVQAPIKTDEPRTDDLVNGLRAELARQAASSAAIEQRMQELQAALARATQAPPVNAPDKDTDPLGHLIHNTEQVNQKIAGLEGRLTESQVQQTQLAELNGFVAKVSELRDGFMKTTPDYQQAYEHMRKLQAENLRDTGVPEHMIEGTINRMELQLAATTLQTGKNPAQVIYGMAKRYGYKPIAAPTSSTEKIEAIKKGIEQDKQLPKGQPDTKQLTVEGLKEMGDDDLNKIARDDDLWHKIVGGTKKDIF